MRRFRIENLPMELLDRLADYSKMDWWFDVTTYKRKTVSSRDLSDLFCGFLKENLDRFTDSEKLELYRLLVTTGKDSEYYNKELLKSLKGAENE